MLRQPARSSDFAHVALMARGTDHVEQFAVHRGRRHDPVSATESLQQELAAAIAELHRYQRIIRAIDHRTRNVFQLAAGLLRLQAGELKHEEAAQALRSASRRLVAIASAYTTVAEGEELAAVSLCEHLRRLAIGVADDASQVQLLLELEDIVCSMQVAVPLGLLASEAITNAVQHAFVDGRRGRITLSLRRVDEGTLCMSVADNGVGRPANARRGMGSTLMVELCKQIGGTLVTTASAGQGSKVAVVFPPPLIS